MADWLLVARRHWLALLLVAGGLALGWSGLRGEGGLPRVAELRRELAALEAESFELLQQGHATRRRLAALRNDDRELERVARRQLHLVRPGEVLYVPADPRRPARSVTSEALPRAAGASQPIR